jgi:Leucine-rich repeat (LRR) protein
MSSNALHRIYSSSIRLRLGLERAGGRPPYQGLALGLLSLAAVACSQQIAVSVNNSAVFDPNNRLPSREAINPDLQGCINLALRQQLVTDPAQLSVLSCANSEVDSLDNVGQLISLRFLDLGGNSISNITPLETLQVLGGLNLANNEINDIAVLFNLKSLVSVSLDGNDNIPCSQIADLKAKLGSNFTAPQGCKN